MTNLLQLTIHVNVRKSHRQPQCTFHFVSKYRLLLVGVNLTLLLVWEVASKMRSCNSSRVSNFHLLTSLGTQPHKQKSNGIRSGDSNNSISVTIQN
jgi:hypothetical protein